MATLNVAEAKARFSELVERAAAGETVEISKRGKPIVKIVAVEPPRETFDWEALSKMVSKMTPQTEPAGVFMRRLRDEGY